MTVTEAAFGVVELRRYATRPGARDALIGLFEREFIESQEACGMVPFGHFRDLDDPDAFVWLRGFPAMETRRDALEAFYTSPVWLAHRDAANATMVDSDNVLLLRPARPHDTFDLRGLTRPAGGDTSTVDGCVVVSVLMLHAPADDALIAACEPALRELRLAARRIASLVTDERPNAFPRLPVREGEFALVVAGTCDAGAVSAWSRTVEAWGRSPAVRSRIASSETLRLEPASRSLLR